MREEEILWKTINARQTNLQTPIFAVPFIAFSTRFVNSDGLLHPLNLSNGTLSAVFKGVLPRLITGIDYPEMRFAAHH